MKNSKLIKQNIDDTNGLVFKCYSDKDKTFLHDRYKKVLEFLPNADKNDNVLEVGLLGGVLALSIKKHFALKKLYTLEHPTTCKLYRKSFLEVIKNNNIDLKPVDLSTSKLPWSENFFNLIILSEVIEHLVPSDIPVVIEEIKRVLKKGGHLLITTPNITSLLKRINLSILGKNPLEFDLNLHENATYGHIREYTMDEIIKIVMEQDFKIVNKEFYSIDTKRNIFTRIEDIGGKIYPPLSNNLAVLVKK